MLKDNPLQVVETLLAAGKYNNAARVLGDVNVDPEMAEEYVNLLNAAYLLGAEALKVVLTPAIVEVIEKHFGGLFEYYYLRARADRNKESAGQWFSHYAVHYLMGNVGEMIIEYIHPYNTYS